MAFRRFATLISVRPIHVLVHGSGKNARFYVRDFFICVVNCQCVCEMRIGETENVNMRAEYPVIRQTESIQIWITIVTTQLIIFKMSPNHFEFFNRVQFILFDGKMKFTF